MNRNDPPQAAAAAAAAAHPMVFVGRPKAPAYKNQLKKHLENKYQSISCVAITAVMKHVEFDCRYADHLLGRIQGINPSIDGTTEEGLMEQVQAIFPAMPPNIKVFLKNDRAKRAFRVTNPTLRRDILDAQMVDLIDLTEDDDDEKENALPPARLKEEMVECGCCYEDYGASEMVECTANVGHRVCKLCINRYVSEQLDGNHRIDFPCFIDDSCGHPYHHANVLEQALSPRLMQRTNDALFRESVKQAGLDVW